MADEFDLTGKVEFCPCCGKDVGWVKGVGEDYWHCSGCSTQMEADTPRNRAFQEKMDALIKGIKEVGDGEDEIVGDSA